ncbi:hypothetical protein GCM10020000_70780 [Streptomyces olivoverticillatus]
MPQPGRVDVGVFQRLPGGFQQHALLGVHVLRFLGRDVEELRVEPVDVVEESAARGVDLPRLVVGLRGEPPGVPPVLGQGHDAGTAFAQERAEVVEGVVAAGEAQADADDGDGLVLLPQQLLDGLVALAPGVLLAEEVGEDVLAQVGEELSQGGLG